MASYNYEKFSSKEYDLSNFRGPVPGEKAPEAFFRMPDGSSRRLLDFSTDFLVIETGSVTCPLFQTRRAKMAHLTSTHDRASFVVLYVREAHPGALIKQHQVLGDKYTCAGLLDDGSKDLREVLVDDLEGTVHKAYGSYPNAVFIVNRNGCVVFASDWNDPNATAMALRQLEAGKSANVRSFFKPVHPPIGLLTFKRSGKGSAVDFFKSFPSLVWHNFVRRNWRVMWGRPPVVKPDSYC